MEISRIWGREPTWWASQSPRERMTLLAHYHVLMSPEKPAKRSRQVQVSDVDAATYWGL